MKTIKAKSCADAWLKTTRHLLDNGDKKLNWERLNLAVEIEDFAENDEFDSHFREIFGADRIDYASSVTFVEPVESLMFEGLEYCQNNPDAKWNKTYWGRLIQWNGEYNQIEQTIKRLKEHKNAKTIAMQVFDPKSDGRKVMGGMPCLLSIDLKPRPDGLHLTAFFRSMRISKSGYADWDALVKMGKFLCEQSGLKLKRVTTIGGSVHLGTMNNELKNTRKLLEVFDG